MAVALMKPGTRISPNGAVASSTEKFVSFYNSIRKKDHGAVEKFYSPQEKAALSELSGTTGGYLVPQGYTLKLYQAMAENSFLWPRANVVPMTTLEVQCPRVNAESAQSAGTSPFFGGMLFQWGPAQGVALTETEPVNGQISLKANDLTGYALLSNQFWNDIGPEGEDYLTDLIGKAAAWYAEYAFFNGLGTGRSQPMGILNATCSALVTRKVGGHIAQDDLRGMASKLIPYSYANAIWATSPSALLDLVGVNAYIPNQNPGALDIGSCCGSLFGKPVFVTDKLPLLGTKGDLVFFDPTLYIIGDRQQAIVDVSDQTAFQTFQTVLRVWLRCDGRPALDGTITLADGASTASAFVVLN